jgi:hypothetical protein
MSPTSAIIVERRRAGRKLVSETVLLSLPGQITPQPCDLRDLTALGAGLLLERFNLLPIEFNLSFDNFRTALACRLVWRDRDRGGVEFRPWGNDARVSAVAADAPMLPDAGNSPFLTLDAVIKLNSRSTLLPKSVAPSLYQSRGLCAPLSAPRN